MMVYILAEDTISHLKQKLTSNEKNNVVHSKLQCSQVARLSQVGVAVASSVGWIVGSIVGVSLRVSRALAIVSAIAIAETVSAITVAKTIVCISRPLAVVVAVAKSITIALESKVVSGSQLLGWGVVGGHSTVGMSHQARVGFGLTLSNHHGDLDGVGALAETGLLLGGSVVGGDGSRWKGEDQSGVSHAHCRVHKAVAVATVEPIVRLGVSGALAVVVAIAQTIPAIAIAETIVGIS